MEFDVAFYGSRPSEMSANAISRGRQSPGTKNLYERGFNKNVAIGFSAGQSLTSRKRLTLRTKLAKENKNDGWEMRNCLCRFTVFTGVKG